ncbi:hypothetical protein PEPS_28090 (plasmid) [Persicobacter psychrovividus]|uniref:Uncharacterized protein n=1 Tax=Persicobacter psychrovividus TaxID=387638 RepID=A0ABN6LBH7_9BACT|nr:hypothetical protein PEPS_28090 [Persicobacter psychrovividus]
MINWLYRILLTFNSTSLLLVIFWIKDEYIICWDKLLPNLDVSVVPDWVSYILYFLLPIVTTQISLGLSRFLDTDSVENIEEVEQANNAFLPSYLGYFFVALSVGSYNTLGYIFSILFVFTFFSQTLYFNPLFLLFKYHFYYLTTNNRVKIFVITRKTLKSPSTITLGNLKRINNFTFIDNEKKL